MFKKILVPLDGSDLSGRALPLAESVARATGAELLLLRVAGQDSYPRPDKGSSGILAQALAELEQSARNLAASGVAVETLALHSSDVARLIVEQPEERQADLIVMATHGRSGLSRLIFGSVARSVVLASTVPILVVAPDSTQAKDYAAGFRLLVPLDGSPFAETALPVATAFSERVGGTLVLVQAVAPPGQVLTADGRVVATVDQLLQQPLWEAERYLAKVAGRYGPLAPIDVHAAAGEPADVIARSARELRANMVVMATHARSGFSRLVAGSVAGEVLRGAGLPLLLLTPRSVWRSGLATVGVASGVLR